MLPKIRVVVALILSVAGGLLWPVRADAQWRPYGYPVFAPPDGSVRVIARPREAEVYVDGFYAGIVDDFDGVFQRLHAPPGEREITLHLDGYRTVTERLLLTPDDTQTLRVTMEKLGAGEVSEPPPAAQAPQRGPDPGPPPVRMGPRDMPRGRPPMQPMPPPDGASMSTFGTLVVRVQPDGAEVLIDGERWTGTGDERLVVQVAEGPHHVEIRKNGFQPFSSDVRVRRGETMPLNVSLSPERRQ